MHILVLIPRYHLRYTRRYPKKSQKCDYLAKYEDFTFSPLYEISKKVVCFSILYRLPKDRHFSTFFIIRNSYFHSPIFGIPIFPHIFYHTNIHPRQSPFIAHTHFRKSLINPPTHSLKIQNTSKFHHSSNSQKSIFSAIKKLTTIPSCSSYS